MPIHEFVAYLQHQKRYSAHTLKAYRADLESFQHHLSGSYQIDQQWDEVTHHMIREWVISLMEQGISARSINRKLSSLKSFFKYLLRQGVVRANPASLVVAPKQKKQLLRVASEDDIGKLLSDARFPNDLWGMTEKSIILSFYHTGIRLSELIGLQVKDVDFGQQKLSVTGKRNKQRNVPLTPVLSDTLAKYLAARNQEWEGAGEPFLFLTRKGRKLYPKLVYDLINNYLRLVSDLEKTSPHVLRHTFATHMLNRGADLNSIKELLGHSNLAATQIYTHNSIDELKQSYNQAHPRGDQKS